MPSLELAAGQVVTAAHTNTYWMRQVIATGLSSARPTPYQGRAVYDTNTDALMIYTTATTGWRPPWNLPWGFLGHAQTTMDITVSNTQTPITAGVSVNVVKGRRIRIFGQARYNWPGFAGGVGTAHWTISSYSNGGFITIDGSALLMGQRIDANSGGQDDTITFSYNYIVNTTGTVGLQGSAWAAGVTMTYYQGCWITIEDIGPGTSPP